MIIVHHLNDSRSQRVLWLLEELGLDYTVKRYQREPKILLAPAELRAVHPLGKSPVIEDEGVTIAESGAIVEYLVERYGDAHPTLKLRPAAGTPARLRYTYWLHYAEGSLMPPLLLALVFSRLPDSLPFLIRPVGKLIAHKALTDYVGPQIKRHLGYIDGELARDGWFAGPDFTAADIQMSFPLEAAASRAGARTYPHIADYLERIHARPAYQHALVKGGPYAYAD